MRYVFCGLNTCRGWYPCRGNDSRFRGKGIFDLSDNGFDRIQRIEAEQLEDQHFQLDGRVSGEFDDRFVAGDQIDHAVEIQDGERAGQSQQARDFVGTDSEYAVGLIL